MRLYTYPGNAGRVIEEVPDLLATVLQTNRGSMMRTKVGRSSAVAVLCLAALAAPAQANGAEGQGGTAHELKATAKVGGRPVTQVVKATLPNGYAKMTSEQKRAVVSEYELTTTVVPLAPELAKAEALTTSSALAAATTCATASTYIRATNNVWGTIYTMKMVVEWCYDGSKVTWYRPIRGYPSVATATAIAGWEFTQWLNMSQWRPGGTSWYVRNYVQGEFRYCPARLGLCIETDQPWIYLDLNGAGGWARTVGGF